MNKGFILPKVWYYIISFTWGLPLTLIGCLVSLVLLICGFKPKQNIYGWYFEIGEGWGGVSLGPCALVEKNTTKYVLKHEFGHSIQNCIFGSILMVPFVLIPSATRYWYYRLNSNISVDYDYAWFENQATLFGNRYYAAT